MLPHHFDLWVAGLVIHHRYCQHHLLRRPSHLQRDSYGLEIENGIHEFPSLGTLLRSALPDRAGRAPLLDLMSASPSGGDRSPPSDQASNPEPSPPAPASIASPSRHEDAAFDVLLPDTPLVADPDPGGDGDPDSKPNLLAIVAVGDETAESAPPAAESIRCRVCAHNFAQAYLEHQRRSRAGVAWRQFLAKYVVPAIRRHLCDIDILLDPFFLHFPKPRVLKEWYPRLTGNATTLADALEILDAEEPWRLQYRLNPQDHPAMQIARLVGKFIAPQ
ncbi:hypothetical protein PF008_g23499 [Phytophthora fragariae]|uniref:Uncharacterized protein n=1 Tax=Phytophthora fragariae TaxID=53985 RepID=A0A6G0QQK8_9STRA|nr:hypothetical protein PF008_g23499 [Phytophthora fragariae]